MKQLSLPLVLMVLIGTASAQITRDMDPGRVRVAVEQGEAGLSGVEDAWRAQLAEVAAGEESWRELFGYNPPGRAVQLAYLRAFLFEREQRDEDAQAAAAHLVRMAEYRAHVPAALRGRAEYARGLPAVPSFFQLADYAQAWSRVSRCAAIDDAARRTVEAAIVDSAEFVFVFPEWGAHNRAMLRAESLAWAARALPDHERAPRWREMAAILAADSANTWEIEDAQLYHPIWLLAVLRYAEAIGDDKVFDRVQVRYYLRYYAELLSPAGTVPDFGDAWWNSSLSRYYACLAWGAAVLRDPELEWAARRVYGAFAPFDAERPDLGRALLYARLADKLRDDVEPREPPPHSGPVLDDVIGKKLVFRSGRRDDDFYLLLNYRDEGDWGRVARDNLRQTLAVEHEKMHHGNADENSIVLLMDRGAVLLHDAGYRDAAPSGPYGAYRADLFHNRLVVRRGQPAAGQSTLEFLRDLGHYRPTRSEQIDFARFSACDYGRTRVTDPELGYAWDRTIVVTREPRVIVVVDTVRFDRPGTFTLATLWATREIVAQGPGFAVGATDRIEQFEFPRSRDLLVAFPGQAREPQTFALRRHRQDEHVIHDTRVVSAAAGDCEALVTVLWPIEPGSDPAPRAASARLVAASPAGRAVGVAIDQGEGAAFTFFVKTDLGAGLRDGVRPRYAPEAGRVECGALISDADFAFVARDARTPRWGATNMTHVRVDEREVFASQPMQVFQTTARSDVVGRVKWRRWEGALGGR